MDLTDLTGQVPYPGMSPDQRVEVILAKYAAFGIVPLVIPVPDTGHPGAAAADAGATGHRPRLHQ